MLRPFIGAIVIVSFLLLHLGGIQCSPMHPLDGLLPEEYTAMVSILEAIGRKTNMTRFSQVSLLEPDKAFVKSWTKGESFPRVAVAYIKEQSDSYKSLVDLNTQLIVSFEPASGEGMILVEEIFGTLSCV
jgi:primary-amine oxidase